MFDKERYKNIALKILSPIKPINSKTSANKDFLFTARRSQFSYNLPDYYLIFFLFADLLEFENLGKFDKVAWSFPIDYNGRAFLIEYRKFGVGVFIQNPEVDEIDAESITKKINGAVKSIRPFYDYIAEQAINKSEFNVINNNIPLFERFSFLLKQYKKEHTKYLKYKGKSKIITNGDVTYSKFLGYNYHEQANWLAISCIEAFFSWTEHLFIHLAIINNNISDGQEVSRLIEAEWKIKFKRAIVEETKEIEKFYAELLIVRQQLRNFVAHGAFGKEGNAFRFHSQTGTVPVLMNYRKQKNRFSLQGSLSFNENDIIELINDFIKYLWKSSLKPSMYYTQKYGLPTILTLVSDGTYKNISKNMRKMNYYIDKLVRLIDDSANMDW